MFVPVTGLEPDFAYPLENVTIPQGRDATFTCVVNNLGGYRVSSSSSASGDHSGSFKRVTKHFNINLCPPVMDYYLIYYYLLLLTLLLSLLLLLLLHYLYARVPASHSIAFNCTTASYEKKRNIYIKSPQLQSNHHHQSSSLCI
jgi:hypothetical protein